MTLAGPRAWTTQEVLLGDCRLCTLCLLFILSIHTVCYTSASSQITFLCLSAEMLVFNMVLLHLSIRLCLSHTWIPSMQPGDITFTYKFFHNFLTLCQMDNHYQLDLIAFK
jgi:hypothetical protein